MKTREVYTVTNNEDHIRLKIYDGDLSVGEAAQELLKLTCTQLRVERSRLLKCQHGLEEVSIELALIKDCNNQQLLGE